MSDQDSTITAADLQRAAETALQQMREQGFDHAQVSAMHTAQDEVNLNHNEASLLRSTENLKLSLLGIAGGRMASTELADWQPDAVRERIVQLKADVQSAPQDEANAVSGGEQAAIVQGPQQADLALLAAKVAELLAFRERETPKMQLDEGAARHLLQRSHTLTSGGSRLVSSVGWYAVDVFGTARDGKQASSFNYTGGAADELAGRHAAEHFGIGEMMRDTEQQIVTQPLGGRFTGEVVFTPPAVADLLGWLLGQLADTQLIAGSSLYRERVGQAIASPLLTLKSRFQAPGVAPLSADAFNTPPVEVLARGVLRTLTPSLYGSRKTGLPHVPVAGGWEIEAGDTPRTQLLAGLQRGAVVGRLSMGNPAPNGDFSAVIKNSFAVENGVVGPAISEVMIAGNMARMLREVVAVSRERLDTGSRLLPWIRIGGLHFS
jgi:PmbA protein